MCIDPMALWLAFKADFSLYTIYQRGANNYREAVKQYKELLAKEPNNNDIRYKVSGLWMQWYGSVDLQGI